MLFMRSKETLTQAIQLAATEKKDIILTGTILSPIRKEERAFITVNGHVLRTSTVVDLLEVSAEYVKFETRNTIYTVFPPAPSDDMEDCA